MPNTDIKWDVLIHLGGSDVFSKTGEPNHIGIVKARTKGEAENKGIIIAKNMGLSGLIEVSKIR